MIDKEPQDYKFKHSKHLSLDSYNGIGAGTMELNNLVADRFMAVSDMRTNIEIVQKPHDRVQDYEEVGFVRVGKFLKMPRLDIWKDNGLVQTRKEDGSWVVAVDDQGLSDQITHGDYTGRFDDEFKTRFWKETEKGVKDCLFREKLLNSGKYNLAFATGYLMALPKEAFLYPLLAVYNLEAGSPPLNTLLNMTYLYAITHATYNFTNLLIAAREWVHKKMSKDTTGFWFRREPWADFNDPFVKNSIPDLLMPPIPVDRLARGLYYLNKHGKEFIK